MTLLHAQTIKYYKYTQEITNRMIKPILFINAMIVSDVQ